MIGTAQWLPAILICLALAAAAWRLRAQAPPSGAAGLENLASASLGPSQRLTAVRAAGRVLLLVVSPQGVTLVGEMSLEEWASGPPQSQAQSQSARAAAGGGAG